MPVAESSQDTAPPVADGYGLGQTAVGLQHAAQAGIIVTQVLAVIGFPQCPLGHPEHISWNYILENSE